MVALSGRLLAMLLPLHFPSLLIFLAIGPETASNIIKRGGSYLFLLSPRYRDPFLFRLRKHQHPASFGKRLRDTKGDSEQLEADEKTQPLIVSKKASQPLIIL